MKTIKTTTLLLVLLAGSITAFSQTVETKNKQSEAMKTNTMNTYVIEREIPNAGKLNAEQLQGISKTSCTVLKDLGPGIEWLHSYVTDNKIYCVYRAESEEILRKHAEKGGFPINSVSKLSTVISPSTATASLAEIMN